MFVVYGALGVRCVLFSAAWFLVVCLLRGVCLLPSWLFVECCLWFGVCSLVLLLVVSCCFACVRRCSLFAILCDCVCCSCFGCVVRCVLRFDRRPLFVGCVSLSMFCLFVNLCILFVFPCFLCNV